MPTVEEENSRPNKSVLSGVNYTPQSPTPNISDVMSYYPEGFNKPATQQSYEPQSGSMDLVNTGAMQPINVGSYSGSIVGNIPIFVDHSLVSTQVNEGREKRIQAAAAAKAKEIKDLEDQLYKVPQLKNAPDQPEMNDIYLNGMEKWKQMYGGDMKALSSDSNFKKWQADVQTAGKVNDAAYEQYAVMGKELDEGKKFFSEDTRSGYHGFLSGMANLGDPTNPESQNFTSKAFNLNQSYDLDHAVGDALKSYHQQVVESDPTKKSMGIYDVLTTEKETNKDRAAIDRLADQVWEGKYKGTKTFSKEQVRARFQEALQYQKENQIQTHSNQFAPKENNGSSETYSFNQKEASKNVSTYGRQGGTETSFEMNNVYKTNTTDQSKKISFPISQGLKYTDGKPVAGAGKYVQGVVSEIGVAKVYKPGLKLPIKQVDNKGNVTYVNKDVGGLAVGSVDIGPGTDTDNPSFYNFKPVAMLNVTEDQQGNSGKNAPNRTVVAPLNEVIGYYAKQGKKNGEMDLTDVAKDVERQSKIQENERLQQILKYNATKNPLTTGKKNSSTSQKKPVTSGNKPDLSALNN